MKEDGRFVPESAVLLEQVIRNPVIRIMHDKQVFLAIQATAWLGIGVGAAGRKAAHHSAWGEWQLLSDAAFHSFRHERRELVGSGYRRSLDRDLAYHSKIRLLCFLVTHPKTTLPRPMPQQRFNLSPRVRRLRRGRLRLGRRVLRSAVSGDRSTGGAGAPESCPCHPRTGDSRK